MYRTAAISIRAINDRRYLKFGDQPITMDPTAVKKLITSAGGYARWAYVNDLGYNLRHCLQYCGQSLLYLDVPIFDYYIPTTTDPSCEDFKHIDREFSAWCIAGRPDGFASEYLAEFWASRLGPHMASSFRKELVEATMTLRARDADLFGAAYREMLEAFADNYLTPANVKPAKK